jgi:hypothetical protein
MNRTPQIHLRRASDWKRGITRLLKQNGVSRYQFADAAAAAGICTQYTAASLVAADGTVRGKRLPSIETAISLARLAGCEIVMVMPIKEPKTVDPV